MESLWIRGDRLVGYVELLSSRRDLAAQEMNDGQGTEGFNRLARRARRAE